ncbi:MAG TPA: DUF4968 domain-containing protein, partial [Paludibacter sp.]|nr:DUF4968 domain-containing protein [Paludibacter sp.]
MIFRYKLVVLFLVVATLVGCSSAPYQLQADGIVVTLPQNSPNSPLKVRLQVITDDIIRVTVTPGKNFKDFESLITAYSETKKSGWKAEQQGDTVILATATTKSIVSLQTGEITFTDMNGNILLQEQKGGGKSFNPIEVDKTKGYTFRQVFESPADEAFYGLGQHQSDEFNWKGRNEELFQYNTKVSVPFVISNKNYGILWDNYSLTRFGDPRPYADLNQFKLFDKNGNEGGLTATYMINKDPKNVFVERQEPTVNYEDIQTIKNFPKDFPFNNASIS